MIKKSFIITCMIVASAWYYLYVRMPITPVKYLKSDSLIVGISPDYPPYAQIDLGTGAIVGLEVDVITEIARRLNRKLEIQDMPFNSLILELAAGQIDVVAAGLTPTAERQKMILFSHPYIDNDENVVMTKKANPTIATLEDLYGKSVAVNIGYTADTFLSKYPEISLVRLKSPADGFMALQANSVYAFTTAQSIMAKFLATQPDDHDYKIFTIPASADACALAFRKNNIELQQEIDLVIDAMVEDGTMFNIKKKWGFA